jgi:hypothetical protein
LLLLLLLLLSLLLMSSPCVQGEWLNDTAGYRLPPSGNIHTDNSYNLQESKRSSIDTVHSVLYIPVDSSVPLLMLRYDLIHNEPLPSFTLPLTCTLFRQVIISKADNAKFGYGICGNGVIVRFTTSDSTPRQFQTLQLLSSGYPTLLDRRPEFSLLDDHTHKLYVFSSPAGPQNTGSVYIVDVSMDAMAQVSVQRVEYPTSHHVLAVMSNDGQRAYMCSQDSNSAVLIFEMTLSNTNFTNRRCGASKYASCGNVMRCQNLLMHPNDKYLLFTARAGIIGPDIDFVQVNVNRSISTFETKVYKTNPNVDHLYSVNSIALDATTERFYAFSASHVTDFDVSNIETLGIVQGSTIAMHTNASQRAYYSAVTSERVTTVIIDYTVPSTGAVTTAALSWKYTAPSTSSFGPMSIKPMLHEPGFTSWAPWTGASFSTGNNRYLYTMALLGANTNALTFVELDFDGPHTAPNWSPAPWRTVRLYGEFNGIATKDWNLVTPLIDSSRTYGYALGRNGWIARVSLHSPMALAGQAQLPYCYSVPNTELPDSPILNPILTPDDKYLIYSCKGFTKLFAYELAAFPSSDPSAVSNITIPDAVTQYPSVRTGHPYGVYFITPTILCAIHKQVGFKIDYHDANLLFTMFHWQADSAPATWTMAAHVNVSTHLTDIGVNMGDWMNGAAVTPVGTVGAGPHVLSMGISMSLTGIISVQVDVNTMYVKAIQAEATTNQAASGTTNFNAPLFDVAGKWLYVPDQFFRRYCRYPWQTTSASDDRSYNCWDLPSRARFMFRRHPMQSDRMYLAVEGSAPFVAIIEEGSCPLGYTLDNQLECTPCSVGTVCDSHLCKGRCPLCGINTVAPKSGMTKCEPCPAGTGASPGNAVCTPASMCVPGQLRSAWYQCFNCSAGFYSDSMNAPSCSPCPSNTYAPTSFTHKCLTCPPGQVSSSGAVQCHTGGNPNPGPSGTNDDESWFSSSTGVAVICSAVALVLIAATIAYARLRKQSPNATHDAAHTEHVYELMPNTQD